MGFTQIQDDKVRRMVKNLDNIEPSVDKYDNKFVFQVTDIYDRLYKVTLVNQTEGYQVRSRIVGKTDGYVERHSQFSDAFRDTKKRIKAIPEAMKFMGTDY